MADEQISENKKVIMKHLREVFENILKRPQLQERVETILNNAHEHDEIRWNFCATRALIGNIAVDILRNETMNYDQIINSYNFNGYLKEKQEEIVFNIIKKRSKDHWDLVKERDRQENQELSRGVKRRME